MMKSKMMAVAVASVAMGMSGIAFGQVWLPTPPEGGGSWDVPANWVGGVVPNAIGATATVGQNLTNAQTALLDTAITVGTLNLGDSTTGFFGYTLGTGAAAGALTFQVNSGNALLAKVAATSTANDFINVPVTLASTLDIRATAGTTSTYTFGSTLSGAGGLVMKGTATTGIGIVSLLSKASTYAGGTTIENGTLQIRGSIPNDGVTPSALGVATSAIVLGNANTTSSANQLTVLQLVSDADTGPASSYVIARGIDHSTSTAAARFNFTQNVGGLPDTGTVTLSGPITLQGARSFQLSANRAGMTINVTGKITSTATNTSAGRLQIGNTSAGTPDADGFVTPATYRFSDSTSDFQNQIVLWNGNVVIAGSVGPVGTPSPIGAGNTAAIGLRGFILDDGNGGSILNGFVGASLAGGAASAVRSVLMETGGTTFARPLNLGGGTGTNANINVYGGSNTATPGNTPGLTVNVINGYRLGQSPTGATNLSEELVWSGNISSASVRIGFTNNVNFVGNANGVNRMLIPGNLALFAADGGTVNFTGTITSDSGGIVSTGPIGSATQGSSSAMRVTINQFRNNPYIDGNLNGAPDTNAVTGANADEYIGTPTTGVVKLSSNNNAWLGTTDIRGGTLMVNQNLGNATLGGTVIVAPGATIGGFGQVFVGNPGSIMDISGTVNPADPTSANTASILSFNKPTFFRSNSAFTVNLNSANALFLAGSTAPSYDRLALNAASSLTLEPNVALNVQMGFEPVVGTGFQVITQTNTNAISGTFNGLAQSAIVNTAFGNIPVQLRITYNNGATANGVTLTSLSPTSTYALAGNGSWTSTGSWTNPSGTAYSPNSTNATVLLGSNNTGPTVIALDSPVSARVLRFDSTNSYTISGAGSLTVSAPGVTALVDVVSGDHTIATPLSLPGQTTFNTAANASITLLGGVSGNVGTTLNIAGEAFFAGGTSTIGGVFGAGELSVAAGTLNVSVTRAATLNVSGGTLRMVPGAAVSTTNSLSINTGVGGGFFDLNGGGLVAYDGNLTAIRAAVASWYNGGAGLGSSLASAEAFTSVAVFPNVASGVPYYSIWSGQPLLVSSVLVRYTYVGDTNIDGVLDGVDLINLIEGYSNGLTGWQNGDFNYDGVVDIADFALFNPAFNAYTTPIVGGPTSAGEVTGGTVPEPSTAALLALAGPMLLTRRRRSVGVSI